MLELFFQTRAENPNVVWLSGADIEGIVLVKEGKHFYFLADRLTAGFLESRGLKVEELSLKRLERFVKREDVGLDIEHASTKAAEFVKKHAKHVVSISEVYAKRRAKKRREEVKRIQRAVRIAEEALIEAKGETEEDFAFSLLEGFAKRKARESFKPIVASKKNSRFPHSSPTSEEIDGLLLVDRGARFEHYCSDLTDVLFLKKNKHAEELYEKLQEAFYAIVDELPSLETGEDVHKHYLRVFKRLKLRPMPHLIGHGVGIEVHELPRLAPKSMDKIEGTTLAIEPAYYGRSFGLRFERNVYVGERRARIL